MTTRTDLPSWLAHPDSDALAVRFWDEGATVERTHRTLWQEVMLLAEQLTSAGLIPGDTVGVLLPAGLDFVRFLLAATVLRLHISAQPLPGFRLSSASIANRLARVGCVALVSTAELRSSWLASDTEGETLSSFPTLILKDGRLAEGTALRTAPAERRGETEFAVLQFTSGTSAEAKATKIRCSNLAANIALVHEFVGLGASSRMFSWLPHHHDMGLVAGILAPLAAGGSTTLMSPARFLRRPLAWLEGMHRFRCNVSGGPDFAFEAVARAVLAGAPRECDLSAVEMVFSGSEPVRESTLLAFRSACAPLGLAPRAVGVCYGLAEATLLVAGGRFDEGLTQRVQGRSVVSVGRTFANVRIIDPESGAALADGEEGEVVVSGPSIAQEYVGTRTAAMSMIVLDGERFLRTGDLGFLRDRALWISGRIKSVIVQNGQKHAAHELEASVERAHLRIRPYGSAVRQVTERVEVYLEFERRTNTRPSEFERRRVLRVGPEFTPTGDFDGDFEAVADLVRSVAMQVHGVLIHDVVFLTPGALPRTTSGKIQRRRCSRDELEASIVYVDQILPSTGGA